MNHPNKELKRIKDLLVVTVVILAIHQTNVGAMGKLNSNENVTIAISMVMELMNAKRNLNLKENIINAIRMGINLLNAKPRY